MNHLYTSTAEEVFRALNTSEKGLSKKEALKRLNKSGPNKLEKAGRKNLVLVFLKQFQNYLVYILFAAAGISFVFDHQIDAIIILTVIVLNSLIGFLQEYKAEKSMQSLHKMIVTYSKVYRNGQLVKVKAENLVSGDLVLLEEGDKIPADCRLIEVKNFSCVESSLTGESTPVIKKTEKLKKNLPLGDRKNMAWLGTYASSGRAKAVVTATGKQTQFGKIASKLQKIKPSKTHFEEKSEILAKQLGYLSVLSSLIIFVVGYFIRQEPLIDIFLFTIASLVSAVPEGLPAVLAITLAVGASRMAQRKAIIRTLPSTETLGVVTTICTDKTGTLTQNTMTAERIWMVDDREFTVSGIGWSSQGKFSFQEKEVKDPLEDSGIKTLINICLLGTEARVTPKADNKNNNYEILGDPTEAGLVVLGEKSGTCKEDLLKEYKIIDSLPFNSVNKFRAALVENKEKKRFLYAIGAPEIILENSLNFLNQGKISEKDREKVVDVITNYSSQAIRTLAIAVKEVSSNFHSVSAKDIQGLEMVGLVGLRDPVRNDVAEAISKCKNAGIKVVMITGDHKATAKAIAREIGLGKEKEPAFDQKELERMTKKEFIQTVLSHSIFARLSPNMKYKIIKTLQNEGETIAVTGDGVNDAPAIKQANIGISMGQIGTDVAREASDIVLADDNFATIVKAIEEGRTVFDNVKKSTYFLLSTNIAETSTLLVSLFLGLPLPLTASQILWLNLVTDGIPAISLAFDRPEKDVLKKKPKKKNEDILNKKVLPFILLMSIIMVPITLGSYWIFSQQSDAKATTAAFIAMSLCQLFNVPNLRPLYQSAFNQNLFSNKFLNWSWLATFLLTVFSPFIPFLNYALGFTYLNFFEIFFLVIISSSVFWIMELYKFLRKTYK
jgi:P-type Ca2+ transporter type 2C